MNVLPEFETVIVPSPVDFVKAKNSAVVPVPTLNVAEVEPAAEVTGFRVEDKFEIINAFCAVTETEVPASMPVIENLRPSGASTRLSEGTLTVAGVLATLAEVIVTPLRVNAIEGIAKAVGVIRNVEKIPILSAKAICLFLFMMPHSN